MIAMAIVNRPQLLIADEPTTALDVTIQAQVLDLLNELRQKFSLAMLFVSHDLAVVSQVSHRIAVMYAGSLVEMGTAREVFQQAGASLHARIVAFGADAAQRPQPAAADDRGQRARRLASLPPGCAFEPRCEWRLPSCSQALPSLIEVAPGHFARCPVVAPEIH